MVDEPRGDERLHAAYAGQVGGGLDVVQRAEGRFAPKLKLKLDQPAREEGRDRGGSTASLTPGSAGCEYGECGQ